MGSTTGFSKRFGIAFLTITALLAITTCPRANAAQLALTTAADKPAYYIREKVNVSGTVTLDGSPVSTALVGLELHSQNAVPIAYRTASVGQPSESWVLNVTDIALWDMASPPNRLNTVKVGETVKISTTVMNPQPTQRDHVFITISVSDGNMVPLRPYLSPDNSILGQTSLIIQGNLFVPDWACSGASTIHVNVYDNVPSSGGIPYMPEKSAQFYISRTEQGWFEYSSTVTSYTPTETGTYSLDFGLSPTFTPGTYPVYSTARYKDAILLWTTDGTTFDVLYTPYPPTASFVWTPPQPYPNTTVTFDASSSSPEGFNDTIIRYEWDWGDSTPRDVTTSPIITHKFMASRTYIVTLNVTDEEELWGLTQKPVTTKQTYPKAAFIWTPQIGIINQAVTFDASASLPGWSIRTASPAPISQYVWNFGDGTGNFTITTPVLDHTFIAIDNFTVLLEVVDTENQRSSVTHIVQVQNVTERPWDINNDLKCDIKDIAIVAKAFGSEPGYPNWNPRADITGPIPLVPDDRVDVRDVALVAKHFGETY